MALDHQQPHAVENGGGVSMVTRSQRYVQRLHLETDSPRLADQSRHAAFAGHLGSVRAQLVEGLR